MIQEEAIILARQAEREMMQNREIKVRCPKCGTMPRITNTLRGERFVVSSVTADIFITVRFINHSYR